MAGHGAGHASAQAPQPVQRVTSMMGSAPRIVTAPRAPQRSKQMVQT
jgi:hypothetical protein